MNALSNGISIYVEDTGKTYHTLDDWDFALGNNNYISEPEMETNYINVPYRNGMIDASTALTGRPVFKKRQLSFALGGKRPRMGWDSVMSQIRNAIHGRTCRLTLDNDPNYYWRGRVFVENFNREQTLGTFNLNVPIAEPYKISNYTSADPWLWNPFSFVDGIITYQDAWTVTTSLIVDIPAGYMPTVPTFVVSEKVGTLTMACGGTTYTLNSGSNSFPEIMVGGDDVVEMTFTGSAKVQIVYRSGSL